MTVAATTNRKTYTGDNVTTSFATSPVIFYLSSNLQVRITIIATGVSTLLTESTHYTVSGGSAAGAVGTVNLAGGSSPHGALLSTEKLVILRVLPLTQGVDLVNNNNSDAEVLEAALDKLTDVDQQIQEQADRSIRFASGDVSGSVTEIPDVTIRSGRLLGFDTLGNLVTYVVQVGTSLVSLAASAGASLIGFIAAGTGAVLQSVQTALRTIVSITQYGAVGDGIVDCSTAVANARAISGYAYVPEGLFLVSAATALGGLWGPGRILQNGNQVLLPSSVWAGYKNSNAPLFVDLHYGILKGVAFVTGEVSASYSTGADVAGGATTFTSTGSVPSVGQLINYLAKDGYYHSAVAINVAGAVVTLDQPVVAAGIGASATNISAFYSNNGPHPNVLGYDTIADYPFVNGLRSYGNLTYQNPVAYNGGTVARSSGNNVIKPGGTTFPGWDVTPGGSSQGCQFNFRPGKTGYHVLRLKVNTVATDLFLSVTSTTAAGAFTYYSANINSDAATLYEIPIWAQKGLNDIEINVVLVRTAGVFYVARAELVQYEQLSGAKINWGKHVLLGDSWFAQTGIAERLQVNLPNSRVVNKGVGGDKASDMVARFATDVTPENPDFVWIMAGTNDYGSSVSSDLFAYNVQRLKYLCQSIGATPIFFGPSVGSIGVSAPQFDSSRQYADLTPYIDENLLTYFDSFTGSLTGCTTVPTMAIKYSVVGDLVTLDIPQTLATSNTTAATVTGMPQYLWPTTAQNCLGGCVDSGVEVISRITVGTNGVLTLNKVLASAGFTNSGTKGVGTCTFSYHVS